MAASHFILPQTHADKRRHLIKVDESYMDGIDPFVKDYRHYAIAKRN